MKVIYKRLPSERKKCVATIGAFDGIHLGHQFILKKVKAESEKRNISSLVVTFDIPPRQFLNKNLAFRRSKINKSFPGCLTDFETKKNLIENLGIDYLWSLKTSHSLLKLSAEDFAAHIYRYFRVEKFIVGEDFHFGYRGEGNIKLLAKLVDRYNSKLQVVSKKTKDKRAISSSIIRELIIKGRFKEASVLLGRKFFLKGVVSRGEGMGVKIGFPTANISVYSYVMPSKGVYAAWVILGNIRYLSAVNVGVRPTVASTKVKTLEAHIINFKKDIIGEKITIIFLENIRAEKKFSSLEKLRHAITRDVCFITAKYSTLPASHPQLIVS